MADPILRSSPPRVVGMPKQRAIFCLKALMPKARFHENESPGIYIICYFEARALLSWAWAMRSFIDSILRLWLSALSTLLLR